MIFFRWLIPTLLVASALWFAAFMLTGEPRYKRWGLRLLTATLITAFGFFAVLITINLLE